jgi:serine/threonine protein kinase
MPVEEVARIVTAVASALDYAHKQGLLHRDAKPANIMMTHLDDDGEQRILLTDFGIARNVDDISGLTATNMTVGTASSYERCATRSRKSDYRFRIAIRKARTKPNGVSASAASAPGHPRDMQCMALVGRHQVAQLAACRAPPFGASEARYRPKSP